MRKVLYIEGCNFIDFPIGGTLSFAKQVINNVLEEFYLVGLGDDNDPIGRWFIKTIGDQEFNYFAYGKVRSVSNSKFPKRIILYFMLSKYIKQLNLNSSKFDLVFSQTPQFVFLICKYEWNKFVFCFAGLGNSVGNSKFKYLQVFGGIYEKELFKNLKKSCRVILAAADQNSINSKSTIYNLKKGHIKAFHTRFDPNIFHVKNRSAMRKENEMEKNVQLLVTTGRIAEIKGWKELIESFRIVLKSNTKVKLIFIGDGEDKFKLEEFAKLEISNGSVEVVGWKGSEEIAYYLNSADLFVTFSHLEGWPTAMVEALACGKNIVTSNVSGANEMVLCNKNGYILNNRSPQEFADRILDALQMQNPNSLSLKLAEKYSAEHLHSDFLKLTK